MGERPTIAFRVDESMKEKWEDAADEHEEYDSLSHLIRVAVSHELSDAYGRQTGGESSSGVDVGNLETALNRLEGRLADVEDGLGAVEEQLRAETTVSDDVLTAVYEALPESRLKARSASEVAEDADVTVEDARDALSHAREHTGLVAVTFTEDGEPRYYRDVGDSA